MVGDISLTGLASVKSALDAVTEGASGDTRWEVGPTVGYGIYQEYGTSRTPAQPFMRPAARTAQSNLSKHVSEAANLDDAVKSIAMEVEAEAKKNCPVDTGQLRASIAARPAGGR